MVATPDSRFGLAKIHFLDNLYMILFIISGNSYVKNIRTKFITE